MRYYHSVQEAAEFLRMTLRYLGEHKLPTDPTNYAVWYEYVSKFNPELIAALEKSLNREKRLTPESANVLYIEHIVHQNKALIETIKIELTVILKEVLGDVTGAGGDFSKFGNCLKGFSETISKVDNKPSLHSSFKELLLEVKNIEASRANLEARLRHADSELKALESKLKEAEQHATTDVLTGLLNRRSFEEKLEQQINATTRDGNALALIILDIDHFKRINDTYGHLTGDDLLRIIAKTLTDFVKGKDVVCRYGGEEFVILLPDTPIAGATTVAEKIRAHFSDMSWKQKSTGVSMGKVTLSFGISTYRPGETFTSFVQRADVALYQSKKLGRNRVTTETS